MADSPRADDGRGSPAGSHGKTTEPEPFDRRLIPGGSFEAARMPVGMEGADQEAVGWGDRTNLNRPHDLKHRPDTEQPGPSQARNDDKP